MRTTDVEAAHEEALEEGFDRDIEEEVKRLAKAHSGEAALLPAVMARAAFWLRVFGEVTNNDPVAMVLLARLTRQLHVGLFDMKNAN